jgi:kinesin family protein 18/19
MQAQDNKKFAIKISYLEIYNEQVIDLLDERQGQLMIVEDPVRGVFVPERREIEVDHPSELIDLIIEGNGRRTMASTTANQFSSRSHAILQISIQTTESSLGKNGQTVYSKLSLIDLAGSERAASTSNRGQRMVEGANINKSLLALGNCINILSDKHKQGSFVPYRDSKLTRLLKDSLGGNTKTCMIACISPSYHCYEESVNTLKYAERARRIKKKTRRNIKEVEVHMSKYKEIIDSLKGEIDVLRHQLKTEKDKKAVQEKKRNKQVFQAQILESKTENDEVLEFIQG